MATTSGPNLAPLPGVTYPIGTMGVADLYPTHAGIGGITTQDRALPAFAEAVAAHQTRVASATDIEGLLGTPAGYLFLLVAGLAVLAWLHR